MLIYAQIHLYQHVIVICHTYLYKCVYVDKGVYIYIYAYFYL